MSKVVIALGGNALGATPTEQLFIVRKTAKRIVDLVEMGHDIIISHGNGPQVGVIYNAMTLYGKVKNTEAFPFAECGAMSQGYIGYQLQQAIHSEFKRRGMRKKIATVVTQVEVDPKDEAFKNPTKPIGEFVTKKEAVKLARENNCVYKEDAGRGYRRVIASPKPKSIVEINTIKQLVDNNNVVIVCGGGGIPVIPIKNGYKGVDAVIDKDRTSSLLARKLDADKLLILTTVEKVRINFKQKDEKTLDSMSLDEAKHYIENNEFAAGSMLPKVEACMEFVSRTKGKQAIITSLSKARKALSGETGTVIYKEEK